jgi:PPM family protein phosphatase
VRVRVGASTDVGRARERNEDSYLAQPPLYAVADGMGGHRAGNVASSLAVQVMSRIASGGWQMLAEQVRQANHAILERARGDRSLQGMGTTMTATYLDGNEVHLAQVGDSRAYLLRDGELRPITTDHTLVHEMVERGQITAAEAEHHPQRSILTRALGVEEPVDVDEFTVEAREGDRILLCSDGLHSMVSDEDIERVLLDVPDPQQAADRLVEMANQAGGMDNITVIVMEFEPGEGFEGATGGTAPPADATADATAPENAAGGRSDITAAMQIPQGLSATPPAPDMPSSGNGATGAGAPAEAPAAPAMPDRRGAEAAPPSPRHAEPAPRRRGGRRAIVAVVVVVAVLAAAFVGLRLYLDTRWFVGEQGGRVALFRGVPTTILGQNLFGVVDLTNIAAARAEAAPGWKARLRDGATAGSEQEARMILASLRADLAALQKQRNHQGGPPAPSPSPKASGGSGASPSP